jgi:hypothetical protein
VMEDGGWRMEGWRMEDGGMAPTFFPAFDAHFEVGYFLINGI